MLSEENIRFPGHAHSGMAENCACGSQLEGDSLEERRHAARV